MLSALGADNNHIGGPQDSLANRLSSNGSPFTWLAGAGFALALLSATTLRFLHLGRQSIWFDEGVSIGIARLDWSAFARIVMRGEGNMVAYHALLRGWLFLGDSEAVIRAMSALAGVATVAIVFALARRLFDTRIGFTASALLAINAFHVQHSQEARGYALAVLFVSLAGWFFIAAVIDDRRSAWVAFTVASVLAIACHFHATLVCLAMWLSLFAHGRHRVRWRHAAPAAAALAITLAVVGLYASHITGQRISWIPPLTLGLLATVTKQLCGSSWVLCALYGACVFCALVLAVRSWLRLGSSVTTWRFALLVSWLCVPFAIAVGASLFFRPMLWDRYMIVCQPALVILAAVGLCSTPPTIRWAMAAAIFASASLSLSAYYNSPPYDDWRSATAFVLSQSRSEDGVVIYNTAGRGGFDYYRRGNKGDEQGPRIIWPNYPYREIERNMLTESAAVFLPQLRADTDHIWLVLNGGSTADSPRTRATRQWFWDHGYRQADETYFRNITVVQWDKSRQER